MNIHSTSQQYIYTQSFRCACVLPHCHTTTAESTATKFCIWITVMWLQVMRTSILRVQLNSHHLNIFSKHLDVRTTVCPNLAFVFVYVLHGWLLQSTVGSTQQWANLNTTVGTQHSAHLRPAIQPICILLLALSIQPAVSCCQCRTQVNS